MTDYQPTDEQMTALALELVALEEEAGDTATYWLTRPLVASAAFQAIIRAAQAEAWTSGHASGRDYQGDGWNSDAHNPEADNPYTVAADV